MVLCAHAVGACLPCPLAARPTAMCMAGQAGSRAALPESRDRQEAFILVRGPPLPLSFLQSQQFSMSPQNPTRTLPPHDEAIEMDHDADRLSSFGRPRFPSPARLDQGALAALLGAECRSLRPRVTAREVAGLGSSGPLAAEHALG